MYLSKKITVRPFALLIIAIGFSLVANAQKDPKTTERWQPVPPVVATGSLPGQPPADAILLNAAAWQHAWWQPDSILSPVKWKETGGIITITKDTGPIATKQKFGDCQLHIEWRIPADTALRKHGGNSGVFFMGRYELQIFDSYRNVDIYPNGQAGSIYKQYIPLVNACKAPGEWQTYDVIFTAPRFGTNGRMITPAHMTAFHNGILIQNNSVLWGTIENEGLPGYSHHGAKEPIQLQDHGDAVSFRNIWIREL
jgi:hypothetical protein